MNNVSLVGRLTKDPELRYTSGNNTAVAGFTLAVNRRIKADGQPDADFLPVVAWQKTAEFCSKYFKKGLQVWVQGRIQTRNWEDDQNVKHYVTEIVAEQVGFADSKKDGESGGQANPQEGQQAEGQAAAAAGSQQQSTGNPPAQGQGGQQAAEAVKKPKPWEVQKQ
jgi:single-strand DNA-binding protein